METLKKEWFSNIGRELLAGLVVCMALIPEAIGFSIVAGVDPMVGVYSSFCISVIIALFGGRTGMISAAAGAMAFVLAGLVKSHGVEYMLAATILTGIIQMILGYFKIGNLLRYIPKPVMLGFVNALGILMLDAQLPHFQGGGILIVLGVMGITIVYLFPRITTKIPSPIVAILVITGIVSLFNIDIQTLGDMGEVTRELPRFLVPNVPFTMETLKIILPYAVSLALVGLVESLLTAQLIDEMTDTPSDKNKESIGQGFANIVAGFFGGIAGCGMIGQTIINHTYGGRGRLSTMMAGVFMLVAVIVFNDFVVAIPVIALAAVMVVVSIKTFNWHTFRRLRKVPKTDTAVMMTTVVVVLATHNLAYGVVAGVLLSALCFMAKLPEISVEKIVQDSAVLYKVTGELFFASAAGFIEQFDYHEGHDNVTIDFTGLKVWDETAVDAIDKVVVKFYRNGTKVHLEHLSPACEEMVEQIGTHH